MKIYPAPEEEYAYGSWEILVDLEDETNDWGVRHGLATIVVFLVPAVVSSQRPYRGRQA